MVSDLVSVIIPMYNSEDRIIQCVNSVLNQTYQNIEVIVIDDGSTDKSLDVITKGIADPRLKVFHHKNQGVSYTRNRGIEIALYSSINNLNNGWITFVDADDYIHLDTYQDVLNHPEYETLDFIHYGARTVNETGKEIRNFCNDEDVIIDRQEAFKNVLEGQISEQAVNSNCFALVTRGLFRKQILKKNKIFFDESLDVGEDVIFSIRYISLCNKIRKLSKPYYTWWRKSGSLSNYDSKLITTRQIAYYKIAFPLMNELVKGFDDSFDKIYARWIISQFNYIAKLSAFEGLGFNEIKKRYAFFSNNDWLIKCISSQNLDSFNERCARSMITAKKPIFWYVFIKALQFLKLIGKL